MMITTILFVAITAFEIVPVRISTNCVVSLNKDVFAEGWQRRTPNGYRFCAYTGIPYAAPPVEKNRFELPIKIPLWKGKKEFTKEANECVQMSYKTLKVVGSEDCLFLNIFTLIRRDEMNNKITNFLLPVFFWIHGGSFNIGSASSDMNGPEYVLEKEIVVVTINYRLGPFGFLSFGNVTRNIGLHDQNMALQWIYENIIHFGGNSQKITLVGWSAGGASVSYHLYANRSKNLFDKAIMMSGVMLNPWAFESDVLRCTYELLKKLNIQNSSYVIDDLKTVDAYDFIPPLFAEDLKIDFFGSEQFCFIPTIDKEFSINSPHILSQQNPVSNVPIMIGLTNLESEWIMSFETSNTQFPNKNLNISKSITNFMSQVFAQDFDKIDKQRFIQSFQHSIDMSHGIYKFIERYVNMTEQRSVFLYRFAFDGKLGNFKDNSVTTDSSGAVHGDDLGYLFKDYFQEHRIPYNTINLTNELIMRERMVTMWTNFIKFGNPTPNNSDITWPAFNQEKKLLLNIDDDITIEQLNDKDLAFQLWDAIYQCLYHVKCVELNEYLLNNKFIGF